MYSLSHCKRCPKPKCCQCSNSDPLHCVLQAQLDKVLLDKAEEKAEFDKVLARTVREAVAMKAVADKAKLDLAEVQVGRGPCAACDAASLRSSSTDIPWWSCWSTTLQDYVYRDA